MTARVVAISRTLGAGGELLGEQLARDLGFRYVDAEIIQKAAEQAGVSPETMAGAEERKGLVERIITSLGTGAVSLGALGGMPEMPANVGPGPGYYEQIITSVISQVAAEGDVVIVAHGASIPLAGMPGLLRVLVTAPADVRAQRIGVLERLIDRDAARRIADSDKARAQYLQRFYSVDHELPTHYDIVVNSEVLDLTETMRAIVAIARGM